MLCTEQHGGDARYLGATSLPSVPVCPCLSAFCLGLSAVCLPACSACRCCCRCCWGCRLPRACWLAAGGGRRCGAAALLLHGVGLGNGASEAV